MQKGKITVTSLLVFCILVLAALMAVKYFGSGIEKKQIKKEVFDEMGVFRGTQLTDAKIREIIDRVLKKRSLEPLEIYSEFRSNGKVEFSYTYEVTTNYILFKRTEVVEVNDVMDNYGG